ncbi:TonB-linked outer membrane protein, SusC/RagA family, partial [Fodinibius roseus]
TQEVPINGRTEFEIEMVSQAITGEEMVVVGYGTQEEINVTGSVESVDFGDEITNRPVTNASQALGGKVSGLWVSQNSGQPGNDDALLRVRGWGTLNNSSPMVIIDGVEGSMAHINSNDIESVSVLKDAASAAIYGSKAANGVVLVTTKSGEYDEQPQVRLSSYIGFQSLARTYDIIDNSAEYMGLWNQALINQGSDPIFPETVINDFRNNSDPYRYPNTNFFEEVYRTAVINKQNISISGGSESVRYFLSLNRLNQEGIMRETNSESYGVNLRIESKINNWLNIGGRVNGEKQNAQEPYDMGRIPYVFANGAYPFIAPYNKDGSFGAVQALNSDGEMIVGNRNPLIEAYNGFDKSDELYTRMSSFAEFKFAEYLNLKSDFTFQQSNIVTDNYNEAPVGYTSTGTKAVNLDNYQIETLEASRRHVYNLNYQWQNILNFDKQFGENHDVSAIAGMQIESKTIKSAFARRQEQPKEGITQVSAGTAGIIAEGNMQDFRMVSYFGRVNYDFSDKYLFEVNARADASSRFAKGNRWGVFPGISAGWRITNEEFMADQNIFSDLKIRGSWGKLGNQDIAGYWPYLTTITQNFGTSYNFGGSLAPGVAVTSLVDESITWETTTVSDVGFEMYFLDNRLFFKTTFFDKKTEDIIVRLPIPQTLGGVGAPLENVGEMNNKGVELNANYTNATGNSDGLSYSIGANFSYVTNEVTKFRGGNSPDQLYLIREGYSYRSLYGYKATGIYQTDQEAQEHMHANAFTPEAGDLRYEDVNKDGALNFQDNMLLGNTIPKYTFGANMDFSYKGFDLNVLFQGRAGVTVNTQDSWTRPLGISGGTITKRWREAWTPENTDTDIPQITIDDNWNSRNSSFWMNDLWFLKVKNIQLGYTLSSIAGLNNVNVYINAQNYFTLVSEDYEGYDPERSTFTSGYSTYPLPKTISFGVNINL